MSMHTNSRDLQKNRKVMIMKANSSKTAFLKKQILFFIFSFVILLYSISVDSRWTNNNTSQSICGSKGFSDDIVPISYMVNF